MLVRFPAVEEKGFNTTKLNSATNPAAPGPHSAVQHDKHGETKPYPETANHQTVETSAGLQTDFSNMTVRSLMKSITQKDVAGGLPTGWINPTALCVVWRTAPTLRDASSS